ncbi:Uncharacterised protein [Candidatus Bartonella washoeensis]|nr:Uncharacterised protein [Bartonella washoeensis]
MDLNTMENYLSRVIRCFIDVAVIHNPSIYPFIAILCQSIVKILNIKIMKLFLRMKK